MKPESLHALVIDHHAGELPPEVADLLEVHLATHPPARAEADRILNAQHITRRTVLQHPELGRVLPLVIARAQAVPPRQARSVWTKAAAILTFSALTATGGFYAGSARSGHDSTPSAVASTAPIKPRKDSPWARYRMALDPQGTGMQVVRVEVAEKEGQP
jgi:anti-sigma factor RsiW